MISDGTGDTELVTLDLSAVVPVVEVKAALILVSTLPLEHRFRLVIHCNALLEFSVVIPAGISPVLRYFQCVQLLNTVFFGLIFAVGLCKIKKSEWSGILVFEFRVNGICSFGISF